MALTGMSKPRRKGNSGLISHTGTGVACSMPEDTWGVRWGWLAPCPCA